MVGVGVVLLLVWGFDLVLGYFVGFAFGARRDRRFDRTSNIVYKMFESAVFYDLFKTCFYFVFVSRVGVRHIPSRAYIHFIDIAHCLEKFRRGVETL